MLRRPEFSEPARNPIDDFLRWLAEKLGGLFQWSSDHPVAGKALIALLVVVLAGLVAYIVYTFYQVIAPSLRGGRGGGPGDRKTPWEVLEGQAHDWPEALVKARRMLDTGNLRQAVWIGHRVLLGLLDETEVVQFAGWKTNTDYLGECPRTQPEFATLNEFTNVYDRAIYAHRSVESNRIARLLDEVDRIYRGAAE